MLVLMYGARALQIGVTGEQASSCQWNTWRISLTGFAVVVVALLAGCAIRPPIATPSVRSPSPTVSAIATAELSPTVSDVGLALPTPIPNTPTVEPTLLPTTPTSQPTVAATSTLAPPTATPALARPAAAPRAQIFRQPGAPLTLRIPKIGLDAPIESVGLDSDGAMATPSNPYWTGWFDRGVLPGQLGNAVIDGHLDSAIYGAAVFWNLRELKPGDKVEVEMPAQRNLTFVVTRTASYPYNNAPINDIFGPASTANLNLITCAGDFDRATRNYNQRLVVYAKLAP
ncbi:MAG TPA: sortase [Chloroflexota bacterium]|nr:sortase [Chloroflexota bacterium]